MKWKTLSSEYITNYKYFISRKDTCEMPDGTIMPSYYVVELPTTVCAVAVTEDNNVVLVKQYRHPIEETLLELPGGFIDKDEDPEKAIARELLEETGYTFSSFKNLGKIAANPGVLNNWTYMFLATGGKKVKEQVLDEHEEIEIVVITLEELKEMLLKNEMPQALHAMCGMHALIELGLLKPE